MTLTADHAQNLNLVHSRSFGIEIECFGPTMEQAAEAIRATGIEIEVEGYNHHTRPVWKIVPDSSVANGFEVVSPILSGNDGLGQVKKVATALVGAGAKVDRRCGFHVHVDARDLTGADLVNCVRRYAAHESVIDSYMPEARRAGNNNFCRSMSGILRYFENPTTTEAPRAVAGRVSERYYKFNLCAFLRHGTVEFRQHSGTVDYRKMLNWIAFCLHFVEDSRTTFIVDETPAPEVPVVRPNSIMAKFMTLAQLLDAHTDRNNPVTTAEIAAALEIEESSVPSYISQFRNRFPLSAIQPRPRRGYFRDCPTSLVTIMARTMNAVPAGRVEVPADRGLLATLAPEVVSYFSERAADLAAA